MDVQQANVEYFFRLVYECFHGGCYGTPSTAAFAALLAKLWLWIVAVGYVLAVVALFVIVYCLVRLFELRKKEDEFYGTLLLAPDEISGGHPRWQHIQELLDGNTASQWREAIIEADIMLDDVLTKQGFSGVGVGDKLRSANFSTQKEAGEAHGVRNRIAHEGSAYDVTEQLARRTVAKYEVVFREFKAI
ncbi:MAG: protein of unknown function with transrane region [Parcubacteria group bacterium]|nr:protein of unknown function with transrane region [Parcubacteria group bacterium]